LIIFCCAGAVSQTLPVESPKFETLDVYVDSHDVPLAAYQVELHVGMGSVVGIEGGDGPAFQAAPFYDPAALSHNRVIVAGFSLDGDLPRGKTRVARIHIYNPSGKAATRSATLDVAANADGVNIAATVSVVEGESK
jgi:hypothetical protein